MICAKKNKNNVKCKFCYFFRNVYVDISLYGEEIIFSYILSGKFFIYLIIERFIPKIPCKV